MKFRVKSLAAVLMFCLAVCISLPTAFAADGAIDDVYIYEGDPNLIIWDSGSHVRSVADASSAYIVSEGEDYEDFAFLSFAVWWSSTTHEKVVEPQRTILYHYEKDTGDYYLVNQKGEYRRSGRHAIPLEYLRAAAHENSDW